MPKILPRRHAIEGDRGNIRRAARHVRHERTREGYSRRQRPDEFDPGRKRRHPEQCRRVSSHGSALSSLLGGYNQGASDLTNYAGQAAGALNGGVKRLAQIAKAPKGSAHSQGMAAMYLLGTAAQQKDRVLAR